MSAATSDPRLARWTDARPPAGLELRAHPSFELVREETAKLEATTGAGPDWALVLRHGDELLSKVGRDVVVGAALASALAHREGVAGTALGARLLAALLADASALPTRARARANAMALFLGRAELVLASAKEADRGRLVALGDALDALESAAASLESEAPSMHALKDAAARLLAALPAPAPEVIPPPPPLPPSTPVFVLPPPAAPALPPSPLEALPDRAEQVPSFLRRTSSALIAAAALVRGPTPLDAEALRLTLVGLYLPVAAAPEIAREGRTALAPPPRLVLDAAQKAASAAPPEQASREVIGALEKHRFALDLHLFLSRALGRAGAASAAELHRREMEGLVARLPALLERSFSDGSPFASPELRTWLAPPSPAASDESPPAPADRWDEVAQLARTARAREALTLGSSLASAAPSARDRFALRTRLARVAEDASATPLAAELYAALAADAERLGLDEWEPALVAPVLAGLLRTAPAGAPGRAAAFARLARVSPAAAFEVSAQPSATPAKTGR
ncbi:MAG: TssA family type VI secretion system protein [Sandaracinus sp.]